MWSAPSIPACCHGLACGLSRDGHGHDTAWRRLACAMETPTAYRRRAVPRTSTRKQRRSPSDRAARAASARSPGNERGEHVERWWTSNAQDARYFSLPPIPRKPRYQVTVVNESAETHRLQHPFYLDAEGVNRPTSPDKHPYYAVFAGSDTGVVPIVRTVNGQQISAKLICRYVDVKEVLGSPDFSREAARAADGVDVSGTILGMDGDQHTSVRAIIKDAFTRPAISRMRELVASNARDQLKKMTSLGCPADLVEDYATPFALRVIGDMLGVPEHDRGNFRAWGRAFLGTADHTGGQAAQAATAMSDYLAEQIQQRHTNPSDDLMSRIAQAGIDHPLDIQVKLALALISGGWETSSSSIARFFYVLRARPYGHYATAWEYLLDHPGDVDAAITELERLYSTSTGDAMPRQVLNDVVLPSGARLRKGEIVIPSYDAANRDPAVFANAERMDFSRDAHPHHLSFGYGAHYCIGVHLGGLKVRTAISLLLRELPGLRLDIPPKDVSWVAGHTITSPTALPVTW